MGMIGYEIVLNSYDEEVEASIEAEMSVHQLANDDGNNNSNETIKVEEDHILKEEIESFKYESLLKSKYEKEWEEVYKVLLDTVLEGFVFLIKDISETRNIPIFSLTTASSSRKDSSAKMILSYLSPKCISSLPKSLTSMIKSRKDGEPVTGESTTAATSTSLS